MHDLAVGGLRSILSENDPVAGADLHGDKRLPRPRQVFAVSTSG